MDDATNDDQVEEASRHAKRAIEHLDEERRLEQRAEQTDGEDARALEEAADKHRAAADVEEDRSAVSADEAPGTGI